MSKVAKLAKSMSIKWAEEPNVQEQNEEDIQSDIKEDLASSLKEQINRSMNSIRSDYETLKNVPGALSNTPSDILEAFFKIWNEVNSIQMSSAIESNPPLAALTFVNLVSDIKYNGVKTLINENPISMQDIVNTMNNVIEKSVSEFYKGQFVPKITFAEELLKAASTISNNMSRR